jgi:hypothetical protein
MKQKIILIISILMCFTIMFTLFIVNTQATTTITSNQTAFNVPGTITNI